MRLNAITMLLALAGAATMAAGAPPQYRVELLPQLNTTTPPTPVGAVRMNDAGWIVGVFFSSQYGDPYGKRTALYRPGIGWQDIGHPTHGGTQLVTVYPTDITADGTIIGRASDRDLTINTASYTYTWKDGVFTVFPQLVPGRVTAPALTNDAGDPILGNANDGTFTGTKAVEFLEGPPPTISPLLPNVPGSTHVMDVNNNGAILGSELLGVYVWEWAAGGGERRYLPPPPGLPYVDVAALNDRNDVIGQAREAGHTETRTAVVWLDGVGWHAVPRTARRCRAESINNLREVVGYSQDNAGAIGNHAWWWMRGEQVRPLEYLIADPPGVYAVNGVSQILDDGRILAGVMDRATGVGRQAILVPIINEPLKLDLVTGIPPALHPPGEATLVRLSVREGTDTYVPGSASVHFRKSAGAAFETIPMVSEGNGMYSAMLPAVSCADAPQFYFTAEAAGAGTISLLAGAPGATFSTQVGTAGTEVVFSESFEGAGGAGLPAGWTTTGLWNIGAACAPGGDFCYDGGGSWAYYGIPAQCNFDTGGANQGSLISPPITLPTVAPGRQLRLTYCTSFFHDLSHGNASAGLWINNTLVDSPSWTTNWERRNISLAAYAGQTVQLEWRFSSGGIFGLDYRGWHLDNMRITAEMEGCEDPVGCYANCDGSTAAPVLNVDDFTCFINEFAEGQGLAHGQQVGHYANCDGSTAAPALNVDDFTCFINAFAAGCP